MQFALAAEAGTEKSGNAIGLECVLSERGTCSPGALTLRVRLRRFVRLFIRATEAGVSTRLRQAYGGRALLTKKTRR